MPRRMLPSQRGLRDPQPVFDLVPFGIRIREAIGLSASRAGYDLRVSEIVGHSGLAVNNFGEDDGHGKPLVGDGELIISRIHRGANPSSAMKASSIAIFAVISAH